MFLYGPRIYDLDDCIITIYITIRHLLSFFSIYISLLFLSLLSSSSFLSPPLSSSPPFHYPSLLPIHPPVQLNMHLFSTIGPQSMAQIVYRFIRSALSVHLPFATDCTASTQCPPNRSCAYKGGFYIHCKDSKLLIEHIEEQSGNIFYCILVALLCSCFLVLIWNLSVKGGIYGGPRRAKVS